MRRLDYNHKKTNSLILKYMVSVLFSLKKFALKCTGRQGKTVHKKATTCVEVRPPCLEVRPVLRGISSTNTLPVLAADNKRFEQ